MNSARPARRLAITFVGYTNAFGHQVAAFDITNLTDSALQLSLYCEAQGREGWGQFIEDRVDGSNGSAHPRSIDKRSNARIYWPVPELECPWRITIRSFRPPTTTEEIKKRLQKAVGSVRLLGPPNQEPLVATDCSETMAPRVIDASWPIRAR